MKNLIIILSILFGFSVPIFGQSALTITKTASNANPRIGEVFEYTINISGISDLSDLGSITDALDPNLDYLGSDFANSSTVAAFFNFWCPNSMAQLTQPAAGATGNLVFNFPTDPTCSGSGAGNLFFKIKVALNASACQANVSTIDNKVVLKNRNSQTKAISNISTITVNFSNPWVLTKTFRNQSGGYLIYDVRLSSPVGTYNINTIQNAVFTDNFEVDPCFQLDPVASKVDYVDDESDINSFTTMCNATTSSTGLDFAWNLPNSSTAKSSYLFQAKIKILNCNCDTTLFSLLNKAHVDIDDICGNTTALDANFDLNRAMCLNDVENPDTVVLAEKPNICVSKHVALDDNNLNITMAGCKGKYMIKVKNCNSTYDFTAIKLQDIFPSGSLINVDYLNATVFPSTYASDMTINASQMDFYSTTSLAPDDSIYIIIPFEVVTNLPNQLISNCVFAKIKVDNHIATPSTLTDTICSESIKTVPNEVTLVTKKRLCTNPTRTCGIYTTHDFLPGDDVEYTLHVYNYGTKTADNVLIQDQLPNYLSTTVANIEVYKLSQYGNNLTATCNIEANSNAVNITNATQRSISGNKILIKFPNSHVLDKFTCKGITHYVVKVKAKIAINAPSKTYTNSFLTEFKVNGVPGDQISNAVNINVNRENLVFTKKTISSIKKDCANKRDTVSYELWALNMGYLPIAMNISDQISVPSPISVASGISNVEITRCAPACGSWQPLVSGGGMTVSTTTTTLKINRIQVQPCELIKIRYRVVYNTNNLNQGQTAKVCNNATFEVGYLSKIIIDRKKDYEAILEAGLPPIVVYDDPVLINQYFEAQSPAQKMKVVNQIKAERKFDKRFGNNIPIIKWPIGMQFIPLDTITIKKCYTVTDCLNGNNKACLTPNGTTGFNFKINSVNSTGIANTQLQIPASLPKISRIEFLLADIRMLPGQYATCNGSVIGNFSCLNPGTIPGMSYQQFPNPGGLFKESNKVFFWSPHFITMNGLYNLNFQLPVSNLNCFGNLEFNIICKIYFEDCSICYQAVSADYHATITWDPSPNTPRKLAKEKIEY